MYKHLQRRDTGEKPVSVSTLAEMKQQGEKIACLTAYDASFAALVDEAGADFVLVGDSLGMVIQGYETTVPVTVDDIVYHTRAVSAGLSRAFLVADMPFMSYTNAEDALKNADIVLSGKSILLNPNWVEDVRAGKQLPIYESEEANIAYTDEPLP